MKCWFFFFNDTATTEIYTLSLHDALPIWADLRPRGLPVRRCPHVAHLVRRVRPRPRRARTVRARGAWLPDRGLCGLFVLEPAVTGTVRNQGSGLATRAEPRLRPATSAPRPRLPGPRASWCRRSLGRTPGTGSRVA